MRRRLLVLALLFANLMTRRVCGQQTTDSSDLTTSLSDPGSSYGVFSSSSSSSVSSAVTDPPLNVSSSTMLHATSPSIQMSSTNFGAPATAARTSFFTDTSSSPATTPNVPKSTSAFTAQANFSTFPQANFSTFPQANFSTSTTSGGSSVLPPASLSFNVSRGNFQAVQMLQTILTKLLGYNVPLDPNVSALFAEILAGNASSPINLLLAGNFSLSDLTRTLNQNGSLDLSAIIGSSGGLLSSPMDFSLNLINTMFQQLAADLPENISSTCLSDLQELQNASSRMEMWAIQMFDAMGKLQAGLLKGQKTLVGQYDECREISQKTQNGHVIGGLFCTPEVMLNYSSLGELAMPLTLLLNPIYVDVCLPDSCTDADVFTIFDNVVGGLGAQLKAAKCVRHKDPSSDAAFWVAIAVMSLLAVLCACGTTYGVVRKRKEEKERKYNTEKTGIINGFLNGAYDSKGDTASNDIVGEKAAAVVSDDPVLLAATNGLKIVVSENEVATKAQKNNSVGLASHLLLCFSVLNNGKKLLDCSKGQADLSCLHGLRVISITWVVLGHCFSMMLGATSNTLGNMRDIALMMNDWTKMPIVSGTLSVDSFFVISGCLTSYIFLRQAQKARGISCKTMVLYYVHRFWRLTPLYFTSLLFYVGISRYLMSGPFDNSDRDDLKNCRPRWWLNVLYVNNIVDADKQCFGWSWYLANDMQFYIIAPVALLPWAYGKKMIGILFSIAFVAIHVISNGVILHRQRTHFLSLENSQYMKNVYYPPWTRVGPFFIGLLLGYALHVTGSKHKMQKTAAALGWLLATATGLTCVYVTFDNVKNFHSSFQVSWTIDEYAVYESLSRPAWACAVAWVIFACCSGSGGFVNTFLSWSGWAPLSRLTYGVYLFHLITFYVLLGNRTTPFLASSWSLTELTISVTVLTYMVSFVFSLLVESPALGLEKVLLGGAGGKNKH